MSFPGLMAALLFVVAPCAMAVWLGTLLRRPLWAFILAWMLTPLLTWVAVIVLLPVLRALASPNNDGTGAIMLPFFGIVTGFVAGVVAATIAARQLTRLAAGTAGSDPHSMPVAEADPSPAPAAGQRPGGEVSPPPP